MSDSFVRLPTFRITMGQEGPAFALWQVEPAFSSEQEHRILYLLVTCFDFTDRYASHQRCYWTPMEYTDDIEKLRNAVLEAAKENRWLDFWSTKAIFGRNVWAHTYDTHDRPNWTRRADK